MNNLYNIKDIYIEKSILNHQNTRAILKKFPGTNKIFVNSHWNIPQLNQKWHPVGESYLWKPQLQEEKISNTGGKNLRYGFSYKPKMIQMFKDVYSKHLNYCEMRYVF